MTITTERRALVWFRRDLRLTDHAALSAALDHADRVWCVFVFDRDILDPLPDRNDRRVSFIHRSVESLDAALRALGGGLIVLHARAVTGIPELADRLGVDAVYASRDYEPAAITRDAAVDAALRARQRRLHCVKDQVVFERDEVLTATGGAFSVFTPYRNAWLRKVGDADLAERPVRARDRLMPAPPDCPLPSLAEIGFAPAGLDALGIVAGETGAQALFNAFLDRIGRYRDTRDFPAVRGPSYLSVHLRFGTIPIRQLARHALALSRAGSDPAEGAATWLSELIWRDFYFQVLHHHPRVVGHAFRPEYDRIQWADGGHADALFAAWAEGRTGYPLVDAAMAQLLASGYMHNRLRMVSASFLVKDLGIDWRRGEAHFARHLIDFDLAANNGGWQWAASTGCDAQPWFRIFNPVTQSRKFDPQGRFIRRYLPVLARLSDDQIHQPWLTPPLMLQSAGIRLGEDYPQPVVDHASARERTLARYAVVRG